MAVAPHRRGRPHDPGHAPVVNTVEAAERVGGRPLVAHRARMTRSSTCCAARAARSASSSSRPRPTTGEATLRRTIDELDAARPVLRVGHLRRRRLHPGPHPRPGGRAQPGPAATRPWRTSPASGHTQEQLDRAARRLRPPTACTTSWPWPVTRRPTAARPRATSPTPTSWSSWSAAHGDHFTVGVAAHPELHPRSAGPRRATAGTWPASWPAADFAITQFFFDPDDYFRMVDELAALGCDHAGASRASCR